MDNEELQILIEQIRDELNAAIRSSYSDLLQLWDQVHGTENGQNPEGGMKKDSLEARIIQLEKQNKALRNKLSWALKADWENAEDFRNKLRWALRED